MATKSSRRALRRHHRERLLKSRNHYWSMGSPGVDPRDADKRQGRVTRTPCLCSCRGCGNPRRYEGNAATARTRAEIRCLLTMNEDMGAGG